MAVPRTRASAVVVHDGRLLCVRLRDPVTRVARLYVPGGRVESAESPGQAAARETLEETGYRVQVDEASERIARYPFVWGGVDVDVTTHFFSAGLDSPDPAPVHDADYNEGVVWLPLDQADAELGFHATINETVRGLLP
jgi:tRNA(adenine34) deaminase